MRRLIPVNYTPGARPVYTSPHTAASKPGYASGGGKGEGEARGPMETGSHRPPGFFLAGMNAFENMNRLSSYFDKNI